MGCPLGEEGRCSGGEQSGRNPGASQRGSTGLRIPRGHAALPEAFLPVRHSRLLSPNSTHCLHIHEIKKRKFSDFLNLIPIEAMSVCQMWGIKQLKCWIFASDLFT